MSEQHTHGELLTKAREGDQEAWNTLVERMSPMVWSVARSFRLDHATATDVAQTVWLRLVEHCDKIADPERLPGWLATTCRREAIKVSKTRQRTVPTEFPYDLPDPQTSVEGSVMDAADRQDVVRAFQCLSQPDQQLLRLMVSEPSLSYEEIAEITGRPIGSLGPSRARALAKLQEQLQPA